MKSKMRRDVVNNVRAALIKKLYEGVKPVYRHTQSMAEYLTRGGTITRLNIETECYSISEKLGRKLDR